MLQDKIGGWLVFFSITGLACYAASLFLAVASWQMLQSDKPAVPYGSDVEMAGQKPSKADVYERLLSEQKAASDKRMAEQQLRIRYLQVQVTGDWTNIRTIKVTSNKVGYWLIEPKLMLGVAHLAGGPVDVTFADQSVRFEVGARREILFEGKTCFLLLIESRRREAVFQFHCEKPKGDMLASHEPMRQLSGLYTD